MAQWLDRVKFGNGKNGSPAVSGTINTYATCTGTATQSVLTTALSASDGDVIMIHQSQGTGAGQWEINVVSSDAGATLNLYYPLAYTYATGAQAVLVPQYTGGTLSGAVTCTAWAGSSGGIIALMSSGDLTISGSLSAHTSGFVGGAGGANAANGKRGEGINGAAGTDSQAASGNAAGGGLYGTDGRWAGGGGGGGNGAAGSDGATNAGNTKGTGGAAAGVAGLTTMVFGGGGGGGGGGTGGNTGTGGNGGTGGGIIVVIAKTLVYSGTLSNYGSGGANGSGGRRGGGGGGGGGSVLIKSQIATLGSALLNAAAGSGGTGESAGTTGGGAGGTGRIHLDYKTSYTGTTTPTLDVTNDLTLTSQVYTSMI